MIPLSDETRQPSGVPIVTGCIIAVNVFVFFLELLNGDAFVTQWSVIPKQVSSGHQFFTIATAMFMHASWSHIIGNMIFLWAFGPEMEDAMGRWRYLLFYLLGGAVAMLAQIFADPNSTIPNLGASGAIAAVMGGFMVTYPSDRIRTLLFFGWFVRVTFVPAALLIGLWFLFQLLSFGDIVNPESGGVAYVAHVAGLAFGVVSARFFEAGRSPSGEFGED